MDFRSRIRYSVHGIKLNTSFGVTRLLIAVAMTAAVLGTLVWQLGFGAVAPVNATTTSAPPAQNNAPTGSISILTTEVEVHHTLQADENVFDADGIYSLGDYWAWLRNEVRIPGRTHIGVLSGTSPPGYTITAADIGSRFSIEYSYVDGGGRRETVFSDSTNKVPHGPDIVHTSGFYYDDNPSTDETLRVDMSRIDYPSMPEVRSYRYLWLSVPDGTSGNPLNQVLTLDSQGREFGFDSGETFTPTEHESGLSLIVQVDIIDASNDDAVWATKYANVATPFIRERPPVEAPTALQADIPDNGGSIRLSWSLTTDRGAAPTGFQYRYKRTALLATSPFTATDWVSVPGGRTRTATIEGDLIHNADYTIEVGSIGANGAAGASETAEQTYRHKTRPCTVPEAKE